jgi:subtilisin family serine protease
MNRRDLAVRSIWCMISLFALTLVSCPEPRKTTEEEDHPEEPLELCIDTAKSEGLPSFSADIAGDSAPEEIQILETFYHQPYLGRWEVGPTNPENPEDFAWAVATDVIVHAPAPQDPYTVETAVRDAFQSSLPDFTGTALLFEPMRIRGVYLIRANASLESFPRLARSGVLLRTLPELRKKLPHLRLEPNFMFFANKARKSKKDPRLDDQWALFYINADKAWAMGYTKSSEIVAVVDMGTACDHLDLTDNMHRDRQSGVIGASFSDSGTTPCDKDSHGTYCAGLIGARGYNGEGISGVCQEVKLMPVKFLDSRGCGDSLGAATAIGFAVDKGAKIVSASWGGFGGPSTLIRDAIMRTGLFVTAAGNGDRDIDNGQPYYPASETLPQILVAGAVQKDNIGIYNFGSTSVDLSAPGLKVISTGPSEDRPYPYDSGTSASAALVAGAAALLKSNTGLSYSEVKTRLITTTRPIQGLRERSCSGGVLDLERAFTSDTIGYAGNCR